MCPDIIVLTITKVPSRITCVLRFSSQNDYLHWLAVLNFNITPFVIRIFYIVSNRQNQLCETKKEIPNTFYSLGLLHHLFKSLSQLIVVTCYFY